MQLDRRLMLVILHCGEIDRSVSFYRDLLGVPLTRDRNEPELDPWMGGIHNEYSWREGSYLHFSLFPARPPLRPVTTGVQIGFLVDDIMPIHHALQDAGVEILHAPRSEPWGPTGRYLDPDGNVVNLTSR
jgi:catechol 2,3-dioxygenase-like lactoylglutathione lyase family enzyme